MEKNVFFFLAYLSHLFCWPFRSISNPDILESKDDNVYQRRWKFSLAYHSHLFCWQTPLWYLHQGIAHKIQGSPAGQHLRIWNGRNDHKKEYKRIREQRMIYRGPGFLAVVWFGFSPIHSLTLTRRKARPATHRKTEKERQVADGRGGRGWVRSRITRPARKPGPL